MKNLREEVMIASMTDGLGSSKSQVSDFFSKLQQTDPDARTRAQINHMTAVLLKNRHDNAQLRVAEGCAMSVRNGASQKTKCVLIGTNGE